MTITDKDLRACVLAYALTAASLLSDHGESAHGRPDEGDVGSHGLVVRIAAVVERGLFERRASWIPRHGR
jgi:hypothetical protein